MKINKKNSNQYCSLSLFTLKKLKIARATPMPKAFNLKKINLQPAVLSHAQIFFFFFF